MTSPPFNMSSCARVPGHPLVHRTAASITDGRRASQGGALTHFRTPTGCRGPFGCLTVHRAPRGRPVQGTAARGGFATTWDLVRLAFRSACYEENLAQFNFCWIAACSRFGAPRYPQRPSVVSDGQKLVLAAMEGRPGQVRKKYIYTGRIKKIYRVADKFDAFVLVILAGSRGWTTATPDDVFAFLCYLDTQGKGTKLVHATSCPGLGPEGDDACLAGSSSQDATRLNRTKRGLPLSLKSP